MRPPAAASTRDKLLFHLKTKGPQRADRLAGRLAVSTMAVRQHLEKLEDDGLVSYAEERQPVGRPARVWRLTERGAARFPDNHADLTVELLSAVSAAFGERGIQRLIAERTKAQLRRYRRALPGRGAPLHERVAALARVRTEEGYMAEARRERDGSCTLVENHCPICAAARTCQGLCSEELELFRGALGRGVTVEREEHALDGARRCTYRIAGA